MSAFAIILIAGTALAPVFLAGVFVYRKHRERIERDIGMVKKL
jgi:hypothetical protein